jgi:hypothetical protein
MGTVAERPWKPSSRLLFELGRTAMLAIFVQLHLEDGAPRYEDYSVFD